jgi:acyl-CoA synthetase (AMP-forming)/AMP-acid ligase II
VTQSGFRNIDLLGRLEEALPELKGQSEPGHLVLQSAPFLRTIFTWGTCDRPWATQGCGNSDATGKDDVPAVLLDELEASVTPGDALVIIYTSGSTGDPKGPVHSHGALVRHSYNLTYLYVVRNDDVMFTSMPFFWIGGLVTGIHAVIHHGATLVTQSLFDAGEALELMERYRATISLGWPQQGKTIAEHPSFASRDLTSLRRTSMPAMISEDRRPPAVHSESLGMTELCGNHLGVDPYIEQPASRKGTFGPSIEGLEHRILDPSTGIEVPLGQSGEIAVRGYSLMQHLYKREREDTFTPDGFYRTGDSGFMDADGWVTFTGRLGELIKTSGGTNVTPAEVETALLKCADVLEAYVAGLDDTDGGQLVVAAIVARAGAQLTESSLRDELRRDLSAYKVPKYFWITEKAALPFTDTGKIRKADLAAKIAVRIADKGSHLK